VHTTAFLRRCHQINVDNVKQLKGVWMTRLKGSGLGGK
jgi:hypothetical protein